MPVFGGCSLRDFALIDGDDETLNVKGQGILTCEQFFCENNQIVTILGEVTRNVSGVYNIGVT